jgi:hypothetical protein
MIPPLSQSRQADLACRTLYVTRNVREVDELESEPARRGIEIHNVIADYILHLRSTGQRTDYEYIRAKAKTASDEARAILEHFCESFAFDPQAILDVECHITLDEHFTSVEPDLAIYEGTLDLITMESPNSCTIWDWKSYYQVVDADTFQGKFYSLLQFCTNPALEKITFYLFFVRYGAMRKVEFTRADVPALKELAIRERARQIAAHIDAEGLTASPGRHCTWCSCLLNGCPLGKVNPYAAMNPEQRLMTAVYLKHAYEANLKILRDFVVEGGPVEARDDNGTLLQARFQPKTSRSYPLHPTLDILDNWHDAHPGDGYMLEGLTIGGLSSPLKAKKRSVLAQQLEQIAEIKSQTDFKVGPAKEDEDESH